MIPKIIHHCWFGSKAKSEIALRCLESWKQHCPDYTFMEWTDQNTAKYQNRFYKQAYRKKQYAFVSDCVRVQVLAEYGGVYLDTDMLLLKPIDELLSLDFFTGYEVPDRAAYGFFGGIAGHRFFAAMTHFYSNYYFNPYSLPVITHTFKGIINQQALHSNERIFSPAHFYALAYQDKENNYLDYVTERSFAVHLWDHSWKQEHKKDAWWYLVNLTKVKWDFVFYGYPWSYYLRYTRGFLRQLINTVVKSNGS